MEANNKFIGQNYAEKQFQMSTRSQKLLSVAVEQAAEIIIITDNSWIIEYINPAFERITGYSKEEFLGKNFLALLPMQEGTDSQAQILQTLSKGVIWSGRQINRKKDGSFYEEELTISPVRDVSGGITNFISVIRDISLLVELEKQLQQSQKLESIGHLAAGIAHEINTPIQYVGDNTRFLQDSFRNIMELVDQFQKLLDAAKDKQVTPDMIEQLEEDIKQTDIEYLSEEIPEAIEQSLDGIQRVAKIVRAMKDFSHPGSDEKSLYDINKALENTVTVTRNEWKYVADMELDLSPNVPSVPCFPGELNQVFLNIIINGSHAIGDAIQKRKESKGKITITSRCKNDQWIEIRISDTGTGIPEHVQQRIFDPFYTTKEVGKGTGQGLAISYSVIVEKHHGTISFETEPGKGTTFIISLPQKYDEYESEDENYEENFIR